MEAEEKRQTERVEENGKVFPPPHPNPQTYRGTKKRTPYKTWACCSPMQTFHPKTAKELTRGSRNKMKEKEAKKAVKKALITSELVKTLEIPEVDIGPANDFNAATELRKLQRKVKNILDDWMEHYRIATGIDSPHIQRMSSAPQKTTRKRKIQSAAAPPVTQDLPASQESEAHGGEGRFQSAPAGNMQWEVSRSSPSPRSSSLLNSHFRHEQAIVTELGFNKPSSDGHSLDKSGTQTVPPMPLQTLLHDQSLWCNSHLTCPVVLRSIALGEEGKRCKCSSHQIPRVTDLEYDHLVNNQMFALKQIVVVCVISSLDPEEDPSEGKLEELYERKNQYRSMPCMQSRLDSFRLLKYDISTADELTGRNGSLLVQRHNIAPGMFLNIRSQLYYLLPALKMYIHGKLLFANYIFNGYSKSLKDLLKQIVKTRSDHLMGHSLPSDFKFRTAAVQNCATFTICTGSPKKADSPASSINLGGFLQAPAADADRHRK
ncbi:uncharacterized protein C3orf20 homolog isoform X2 [Rhinatrema bivittatum]|uniref:uncharacterized protein C3orf20 homolog isoform X2 n=1 Tax=Rhinatrema bivittatum TaxID=194408 RepID=UPI0011262658|nr:uncharacterized protein C3orf20 homolog isoform X2 [Rhinatrema bivittatum]